MPVDVLGLGAVAVDDLLYVDEYPEADAKVGVSRRERHCGGLTATALVAASRYGSRCRYAGVLGTEDLSDYAAGRLEAEGVDLTFTLRDPASATIHAVIVVGARDETRTIFAYLPAPVEGALDWPAPEIIRDCRVLFVDTYRIPAGARAAAIARAAGIPVVADMESGTRESLAPLLEWVDHLVIPLRLAQSLSGLQDPAEACAALWHPGLAAVVVTAGDRGAWYAGSAGSVAHQPAFPVPVVDTTGCGDVFHGLYAAALAQGLPLAERVRRAAAAAAMKATRPGGQDGIPTREALEAFLKERQA